MAIASVSLKPFGPKKAGACFNGNKEANSLACSRSTILTSSLK